MFLPPRIDFNPRPLAGATNWNKYQSPDKYISIHAPSRGRQLISQGPAHAGPYFNPRPLAGATKVALSMPIALAFQSTPPRGGDTPAAAYMVDTKDISIHAPSRGRLSLYRQSLRYTIFQSTPPRGGDHTHGSGLSDLSIFQSTPPRGGDKQRQIAFVPQLISIHAPSRGRRGQNLKVRCQLYISIHAPSRGRLVMRVVHGFFTLFQSTPPRGGDALKRIFLPSHKDFNPRPLAGATE